MRFLVIAVAYAMALIPSALAEEASTAPVTLGAVSMDEAHLNEKVCKQLPPKTGSRIPGETICMTNRQWITLWRDSAHIVHIMQNKSISKNSPPTMGDGG